MSLSNWRQFSFFELTPIKDPTWGSEESLYSDPNVTAVGATDSFMLVAQEGQLKLVKQDFTLEKQWRVEDVGWSTTKIFWLSLTKSRIKTKKPIINENSVKTATNISVREDLLGIVVTVSERQGQPISIKLWDLDKLLSKNYNWSKFDHNSSYRSKCSISNTNGLNNYPLTCLTANDNFSVIAAGFANGTLVICRGDLIHDRGTRQRIAWASTDGKSDEAGEPITGLQLRDDDLLYVCTISKIFTVSTLGRNHGKWEKLLDGANGCDINCSNKFIDVGINIQIANSALASTSKSNYIGNGNLNDNENRITVDLERNNLLIGTNKGLHFYNSKGLTNSILLENIHSPVKIYKNRYVLFESPINSNLTNGSNLKANKIIIIDLLNKFVVFTQTIGSNLVNIWEMWDDWYALSNDGILYKLHELSTKEKVEGVIQRELFEIGIKLANSDSNEFSEDELLILYKKYGDHLYKKEEYEDSIENYIKCIKLGKTSEIIIKFKDSTKIKFLVKYLESLIKNKLSTSDHVTLLLSCYCKLKNSVKIENYIEKVEIDNNFDFINKFEKFDLDSIIDLCKDNNYFQLASKIAQKFNLASKVVSIHINDLNNYAYAMKYMKTLQIDDLLYVLVDNLDSLLNSLPHETTQLLIDIFTGNYKSTVLIDNEYTMQDSNDVTNEAQHQHPILTSYSQFVTFMKSQTTGLVTSTVSMESNSLKSSKESSYQPPRPRIIFSSFSNHTFEFVIFLEACIESYEQYEGSDKDKKDIMITLYELYLMLANDIIKQSESKLLPDEWKQSWEEKAKNLLFEKSEWALIDRTSLLLISNIYDYKEGEVIVRSTTLANDGSTEISGYELDMFRSATLSGKWDESFNLVIKYGEKNPDLFRMALVTFTSSDFILETIGEERITKILDIIEKNEVLTTLEIVEAISGINKNHKKAKIRLGLIKPYLLRSIAKQKETIEQDTKLVEAYEKKVDELEAEIKKLKNEPYMVNINNGSGCEVCKGPNEWPMIFFKCGHQAHESCLIENGSKLSNNEGIKEAKCPACTPENEALNIIQRQIEDQMIRADLMLNSLEGSSDRFKEMMTFLGRGGMNINMNSSLAANSSMDEKSLQI